MKRIRLLAVLLIASGAQAASYNPVGPQTNVPLATITGGGWKQCYAATMATPVGGNAENVLSACNGNRLMMAGRVTGGNTFLVLAAAPRAEAIFNTGGSGTHLVNGANWYFSPNWSWGFTAANDTVNLNSCDFGGSSPTSMCLHTSPSGGGYRINDISELNYSSAYEKVFFVDVVPGAYDDSATANMVTPVNIDVLANDSGFDDPVDISISTAPLHGTAVVNGSPGDQAQISVTYTPASGFAGVDTFQYFVNDGTLSGTATVTVTVNAPQANPDTAETGPATPVSIDILANDLGFNDPVTVSVTGSPLHGTAVATGSPGNAAAIRITYTPAAGYSGSDNLQYQVTDGASTASAAVSITVLTYKAIDDEIYVLNGNSDAALFVAANDVGFTDPVDIIITSSPGQGSADHTHNSPGAAANAYIHYFVSGGETYTTTMTYELRDSLHSDSATVTIHVVDFIARDDRATTGSGIPVTIPVTQNDLGFNYPRTVGLYTSPRHGSVVVDDPEFCCDDATIIYTPEAGFLGEDSFEYAIDDGVNGAIATVTVRVVNDTDNDLVDDSADNCIGVANAEQRDGDGDGYGNLCDADFDNNGMVNFADLGWFRTRFATPDPTADLNGNGMVNFADLAVLRTLFGKPPGPSALIQ